MNTRRFLLLAVALLLAALLVPLAGDAGNSLFATMKAHQSQLAAFADAFPREAALAYVTLFVAATALSIPVATALTVVAGSVFGFTEAMLLTVFAGASGATLAMLMARYFFRDAVERRWPEWAERMDRGIARDGAFYLLSLRLAPVPPFFVVNVAMGLTRLPARQFFLVSLVGLAPLDAVFINAGHMLAKVQSPEEALSPGLIAAFALIGIAPLLMRRLLRRWGKARRKKEQDL